ncbi:MAG: efflux RND transporter periplasmic adaptor subunit [Myxococcaceae bacterium]
MKWWKVLIAAVLLLGATAITVGGLRERPPPAQQVTFATAKKATITRTISGAGKVQAATTVKISSNLSGDLTELSVAAGDRVTKGQVLGRIDRKRFEAASRQAQAAASAAKAEVQVAQVDTDRMEAELKRVTALVEKGISSPAEGERSKSDRDSALARLGAAQQRQAQASAALEEAQTNLSKTTLTSPIDGTVIEVSREIGERVRGSDFNEDVVMTIAALAAMEVKIEVGEHEVVYLKNGQRAEVTMDALEGQTFEGSVVEIAQKANIKNPGTEAEVTSFPITVALTSRPPGAMPGMSAEVRISAETHEGAVTIPIQAVTVRSSNLLPDSNPAPVEGKVIAASKKDQLAKVVFVVSDDNKVHVRRVRTGIASDTEMEILEGLQPGDKVVEGPYRTLAKDLKDNDAVEEDNGKGGGNKWKKHG